MLTSTYRNWAQTKRSRTRKRRRQDRQFEVLEKRLVLDSTVVFNEIMYNPPGESQDEVEWIEFYNQLAVNMDISEWRLEGGVDFEFPDGTIVSGRGYVVVASDPDAFQAHTGVQALGPFEGRLNNAGEELRLLNNDERLMNTVDYRVGGQWPAAPDGSGATLAKASQKTASEVAANWTFSPEVDGTPGAANFVEPGSFIFETVLPVAAEARVSIPFDLDGSLGTKWIDAAFDDSTWTAGSTGVGFDNGRSPAYQEFLGLDLGNSMQNVNASAYIRIPFQVSDHSAVADADLVLLQMQYDDGFVAYVNGVEVAHANAPGRDGNAGSLSWLSNSAGSHRDSDAVRFADFNLNDFRDVLVQGDNLLAIHALNSRASDDDFLITPKILYGNEVLPDSGIPVAINEVASGDADDFYVELSNDGSAPVDLGGFVLAATGAAGGEYVFSAQTLAPGGLVAVNQQQLGFAAADGANVFLYSPGKENVVDGRPVTGRLRGRAERYGDRWLYPDSATMGAPNSFQFQDNIVINEIMYHAPPAQLVVPATPPTIETSALVAMDASGWRYRQTADPLPADWASVRHEADGTQWVSGQGPLGFDIDVADQINTQLEFPALRIPPFITYYFENDFELPTTDNPFELELTRWINGGAVFYLNGVEFHRFNMPDGEIQPDTPALRELRSRQFVEENATVPPELVLEGTNRLSVEVHRTSLLSIDVVMGAGINFNEQVDSGIPVTPFRESDEEWIELYNRGRTEVDLGGWTLRDAVSFEFSQGTTLGADQYLVVANDAEALAAKYPSINIVGDFSGVLSNHDDRIRLLAADKNPADEVHYYESGRWAEFADSGGSSLELRNPDADNANAETWAASDETGKSLWQTYTFRKVSQRDVLQQRARFNEFIFGLLDSGEFLLDDVQVVHDPDGQATQLIQNGTFEADTLGAEADTWRIIGNHSGTVVVDPENPTNQVLHVVASGAHAHPHDHAETTFVDNTPIVDGDEYEFSFRAKWLTGNSQLNTRLFFTRAGHTTYLAAPQQHGTPGTQNSTFEANIGPTYERFGHSPLAPNENLDVTVVVRADDPDGVASVTLWWRQDPDDWNQMAMSAAGDGIYQSVIPRQSAGTVIQFYVEGVDGLGNVSTFPAAGPDSGALYQVDDNHESRKPNDIIDTIRVVMLREDQRVLYPTATNQMSNAFLPATLIHNNEVFYDIGARQIGSRFIRPNSGLKLRLNPDQAFYGVHDSIRFDIDLLYEMAMKQMINRAGGTKASMYDDLAYVIRPGTSPGRTTTGSVLLQLGRYESLYLDEQFENGSDGTKFELDDITYPSNPSPSPEGLKRGTEVSSPDMGIRASVVEEQGGDREFYRGHLLIKSQRQKDDYESIVQMVQAMHLDPEEGLDAATREIMDIDLWMRHYAHQSFLGNWDTYGFRRPKNLRLYVRPEDGKVIPLVWDSDRGNYTEPIYNRSEGVSRLDEIRDIPSNLRLFWGHMLDLINRSFNEEYIAPWAEHYIELVGQADSAGGVRLSNTARLTGARVAVALREMETGRGGIPKVDFAITSEAGTVQIADGMVTLKGTGWIDIREIHVAGSDRPLVVNWPEADQWEIALPLGLGENNITLEAFDYQGTSIASESITVTSDMANPVSESLRITEINYNPSAPTSQELAASANLDNDDFEFIEVRNVGSETINLLNARFTDGIEFQFPVTLLAAGQSGVIVRDMDAFALRYGSDVNVIGQFARGGLNNAGEQLTLVDALDREILDFEYSDGDSWPDSADGVGATLQLIDPASTAADSFGKYYAWRGSTEFGGSPGEPGAPPVGVVVNEVLTNTDQNQRDAIELYNRTNETVNIGGWYLSDSQNDLLKYQIPSGTTISPLGYVIFDESKFNPTPTQPAANHFALSGSRGDDVWLVMSDDAGDVQAIVDDVHFGAARVGESFGRTPNGQGRLAPMSTVTLGAENAAPRVGPVVISEVQYAPGQPTVDSGMTSDDLEFVEIVNTSSEEVALTDWRIRGGIDFEFDAGTTLGPGQVALIISFNPSSSDNGSRLSGFRTHYGIDNGVTLLGGYRGQLSDTGERVQLQRAGESPADNQSFIPRLLEDEVLYDILSPWPSEAAGSGKSLTRTSLVGLGNAAGSWTAADPSLGTADTTFVPRAGDANMDRQFDHRDIVALLQADKYLTGQPATFAEGDFNDDGFFDQRDIVAALASDNYLNGPYAAAAGDSLAKREAEVEEDAVDVVFALI